jgi:hypothetical protein
MGGNSMKTKMGLLSVLLILAVIGLGVTSLAARKSPPGRAIEITNIRVAEAGTTYVVIEWNVNPPAQGQVEYGTTPEYGQLSTLETDRLSFHSQRIEGLTPATRYHFRVIAIIP